MSQGNPRGPKNTIRIAPGQTPDGARAPIPMGPSGTPAMDIPAAVRDPRPPAAPMSAPGVPAAAAPSAKSALSRTWSAPHQTKPLRIGDVIGRYRVIGELGSGGFAEVYEVVHLESNAPRALKVLNVAEAARRASVERFNHECRTVAALKNVQGVVTVVEVITDARVGLAMVMEKLTGRTLRDALIAKSLTFVDKLWASIRIARAMGFLHENDIIHRDLKPENIFLELAANTAEGAPDRLRPVILDLGCAKTDSGPTTSAGAVMTTWQYASPEQLGRGILTSRSDIYAFGCILYEMFEGAQCYQHLEERAGPATPKSIKAAWHVLMPPKLPEVMPVALWNDVVGICLQKEPDLRFPRMRDVEDALTGFARAFNAGEIARGDFLPAALAGARARPVPKPLAPVQKVTRSEPAMPAQRVERHANIDAPSLVVVGGPPSVMGMRWALGRSLTIGRWLEGEPRAGLADITFPLDTLSTRHCKLEVAMEDAAASVYLVEDLKSTNGTQLAGTPITEGILRPGSTLTLGGDVLLQLCEPGVGRVDYIATTAPDSASPVARAASIEGNVDLLHLAVKNAREEKRAKADQSLKKLIVGTIALAVVLVGVGVLIATHVIRFGKN